MSNLLNHPKFKEVMATEDEGLWRIRAEIFWNDLSNEEQEAFRKEISETMKVINDTFRPIIDAFRQAIVEMNNTWLAMVENLK